MSSNEPPPTDTDEKDASPLVDRQTRDGFSSPQAASDTSSNTGTLFTCLDEASNADTEVPDDIPVVEESFNMSNRIVTFLVDQRIFRVHDYFFVRDSDKFCILLGGRASTSEPVPLPGVKSIDFKRFLSVLYPTDFDTSTLTTRDEWASVLHIAAEWGFATVRKLAIRKLFSLASPVDRIVFGRCYDIPEWLVDAYVSVCTQEDLFDEVAGEALGAAEVVKICRMREALHKGKIPSKGLRDAVWRACCPAVFLGQPALPHPETTSSIAANIPPAPASVVKNPVAEASQVTPAKPAPEVPKVGTKPDVITGLATPAVPPALSQPTAVPLGVPSGTSGSVAPPATGTPRASAKRPAPASFDSLTTPLGAQPNIAGPPNLPTFGASPASLNATPTPSTTGASNTTSRFTPGNGQPNPVQPGGLTWDVVREKLASSTASGATAGTTPTAAGGAVPATTGSSSPAFSAYTEKDAANASITLQYQTITCMPAYQGISIEEIRVQDYAQNRKPASASGGGDGKSSTKTSWTTPATATPFGGNPFILGPSSTPLNTRQPRGSLFEVAAKPSETSASLFGSSGPGLFGAPPVLSQAAAPATGGSLALLRYEPQPAPSTKSPISFGQLFQPPGNGSSSQTTLGSAQAGGVGVNQSKV